MSSSDGSGLDFEKCQGILINGLCKIQQLHHNALPLTTKGGQYLESLLLKLLSSLLVCQPKTVQDAKDQVSRKFPKPLSNLALDEAKVTQEKGKKKATFAVDKLHHALKEQNTGMDKQVTLLLCGVLEYIATDILKLTTNYAKNISSQEISDQDIQIAMFADNILMTLFHEEADDDLPCVPIFHEAVEKNVSYESLVRDFMAEEARYLRDLNLIIKLVRRNFISQPKLFTEKDVDIIFSNVEDLAELSVKMLSLLEEAVEMTDEVSPIPLVGSCFEDLAEECAFELYSDYTLCLTSAHWRKTFDAILEQANVNTYLMSVCPGFRDVVAYVLPKLLLAPIYHCFHYIEQIELLEKSSRDPEDRQSLGQALSAITPIKQVLDRATQSLPKLRPSEASLRISWRGGPRATKMSDIEKSIDGWWGRSLTQSCNEFLHEGDLLKVGNKRTSERRVFLFDLLLISCKSNQARRPAVAVSQYEYRLKERIIIRKAVVRDISDSSLNQFEISDGESETVHVFQAKSKVDKQEWMSHLIRLQHRSTFDRMLDQVVREEAAKQELRLPPPEKYCFLVPDSKLNIILEEEEGADNQITPIKGGTVLKLVERLTYHLYSDTSFTKTFLTTFRSFCKQQELLDLLIKRYNIPDPDPTAEQHMAIERGEIPNREDLKRFRKEFAKPIQLRVMNVIRQWLEHHWYDFERDEELLSHAEKFISSVRGKNMQKWARTMQKIIARKKDTEEPEPTPSFTDIPPPVEWHLTKDPSKFTLFTLHPIEIARQLTLIEFDLYRKVRPSEMIGSVWTKVGKETNSPNLLKMIHFSTKITRWVSKTIVELQNHEDRVAAMIRAIDVMQIMKQLNNFNGLLEFVASFNSSAVHRLNHTKESLPDRYSKTIKQCMDLCDPRLTKTLERLRSIDPPCVPFVGTFLTNILKTEEGNPHLLPNQPEHLELINFSKRRKVAAIMLEVQQYQNQMYNLKVVPEIKNFFLKLDPLEGRTEKEFNDHLFHTSLIIEPREVERPPKFPRSLTDKETKSPGTAPSKRHVVKATTREDLKQSAPAFNPEKRHSLVEEPVTQKPPSFDTMSIKSFAHFPRDVNKTPSPKAESPPPRPPREPRRPSNEMKVRDSSLVSAPPVFSGFDQNRFIFEMPSARHGFRPVPTNVHSLTPMTPSMLPPKMSAMAPLSRSQNGTPQMETERLSPPTTELMNHDPSPPPIPPRGSSYKLGERNINGSTHTNNVHAFFSQNIKEDSSPPPIPPRDPPPPTVPPRAPVRAPPPYSRNFPEMPCTPHINGGRYVPDPTWDQPPPLTTPEGWSGTSTPFENYPPAPPYSVTDVFRNEYPPGLQQSFNFPDVQHPSPASILYSRNSWDVSSSASPSLPQSTDVPPPIPKRQPSSTMTS